VPVLFRTGSALGIYPSELSPSGRYPARFRVEEPTYRFSCRYTCAEGTGRLDRPRFLGFCPSGSPWQPDVLLTRQPLDAPLGFTPLGPPRTPWPGFRPASSRALSQTGLFTPPTAPQSLDQRPLRLDLPSGKPKGAIRAPFVGFPHRPESLTFERAPTRAIWFASRRAAHYCRPTDVLWMVWRPTRAAGTG